MPLRHPTAYASYVKFAEDVIRAYRFLYGFKDLALIGRAGESAGPLAES